MSARVSGRIERRASSLRSCRSCASGLAGGSIAIRHEQLQHVVLDHVLERAGSVVVAGPALERERLLPEDLDLLDVGAVPHRLQDPVREPQREQVLHGRHAEDVVDAEDRLLAGRPQRLAQQPVERDRALEILAERLLEGDPAARRQPGARQARSTAAGNSAGRQREVGRDRAAAWLDEPRRRSPESATSTGR